MDRFIKKAAVVNIEKQRLAGDTKAHMIINATNPTTLAQNKIFDAIGGGVGGIGGLVVGGPPAAIVLGASGAALGGAIGGTTAFILCEMTKESRIKNDPIYKLFRDKMIRDETLIIFKEQLKNDSVFDPLCCPFSSMLPEIPMLAPCGHVYNKLDIDQHLDRIDRETKAWKDSGCGGEYQARSSCAINQGVTFKKSDLVFHESHITAIMERCLKLREIQQRRGEGVDENELNRTILLKGLDQVLSSSRQMLGQVIKIQHNELLDSVVEHKGEIRRSEFLEAQNKIFTGKLFFKEG